MTVKTQRDITERLHSLRIVRDTDTSGKPRRRILLMVIAPLVLAGFVYLIWSSTALHRLFDQVAVTKAPVSSLAATPEPDNKQAIAPPPTPARFTLAGYLVAKAKVDVAATVRSTITALHVQEGDQVSAGQRIADLDGSLAAATLAIAKAEAKAAAWSIKILEAELAEAEAVRKRTRVLSERGLSSQATMDKAETSASTLASRLQEAIARHDIAVLKVEHAKLLLGRYRVTAPIAGTVTDCAADVGEAVSPETFDNVSNFGICTIVDFSSIVIEIDVPENMIHRVQPGAMATATLDAYPNEPLKAIVQSISPVANRAKSTIQSRLAFTGPQDTRLRPNMAVTVRLEEK